MAYPDYMTICTFASAFVQSLINVSSANHEQFNITVHKWLKVQGTVERLLISNPEWFHPLFGFIDIFAAHPTVRTYRPRMPIDTQSWGEKFICPLPAIERGQPGQLCTVQNIEEFRRRFAIFTQECLGGFSDWSGIVVAGGAVQLCLTNGSLVCEGTSNSDLDLFFYGMDTSTVRLKH